LKQEVKAEYSLPQKVADGSEGSLINFVVSLNLKRRHLTSSQKAVIALDILPMLEAEAKERQRIHGDTAPGRGLTLVQKVAPVIEGKARDHAARLTGT
jgi:hypothetical protein